MHGETLHWGICSPGRISHDFVLNLRALPANEHLVRAVASSSLERAGNFAKEHSIPRAYGSYQELADDPDVDVVYIGSLNTQHYNHAKMMLEAGKNVLCEKPLCTSAKDAETLFALSKEKNVFLMEAIWSRCFPAYEAVREAIKNGEIGDIRMVQSAIGKASGNKPGNRVGIKEFGGGALFDLGIYQLQLCQFIFEEKPTEVHATGFLNDQGVDVLSSISMKYSHNQMASLACSAISTFPNCASICGTKGFVNIHAPFWCPAAITINDKTIEFPLPKIGSPMIFPNSEGLTYEAQEVRKCLLNKLIESPRLTHAMSTELANLLETIRKKLGYTLPHDD